MKAKAISMGLALAAAILFPTHVALAEVRTFEVRAGTSRVSFVSDAPLETLNGVSSQVSGELRVDTSDVTTARGAVEVATASLRTGNDLRDEHLRSSTWLDAANHPAIRFELLGVSGARELAPNRSTNVEVRGRFTLHGVSKEVTVRAQVKLMPLTDAMRGQAGNLTGDVLRIHATFNVRLTDFGVSVPSIVQLKVSNEIAVEVSLTAVARPR
ncbi:MAG: YceI family protein [Polyangiales bacterium]